MRTTTEHPTRVHDGPYPNMNRPQHEAVLNAKILSNREREVLRFIGLGYSIKETSKALFLSAHTIISHRDSIKEKYDCRKSTQLAVLAERLGLLRDLEFSH